MIKKKRPGLLFIFSGPSGVGKTTICKQLLARVEGLQFSVSYTTRSPRADEVDGKDYFFTTTEKFEEMISRGEFAEYASVHGAYYGTHKEQVTAATLTGRDVLLDIDVQGARAITGAFDNAVSVFVLPPSWEELESRIRRRGQNGDAEIARRMATAKEECAVAPTFNYFIVNDALEAAVAAAEHIIYAERQRLIWRR